MSRHGLLLVLIGSVSIASSFPSLAQDAVSNTFNPTEVEQVAIPTEINREPEALGANTAPPIKVEIAPTSIAENRTSRYGSEISSNTRFSPSTPSPHPSIFEGKPPDQVAQNEGSLTAQSIETLGTKPRPALSPTDECRDKGTTFSTTWDADCGAGAFELGGQASQTNDDDILTEDDGVYLRIDGDGQN
mgnify:CR=1 FL=1